MWLTWMAVAVAGEIVFDAQVPVEIRQGPQTIARLFFPGELRMPAPAGPQEFTLMIDGNAQTVTFDVPAEGAAVVVVGRTSVTTGQRTPESAPPPSFELRAAGSTPLLVILDGQRIAMRPGESKIVANAKAVHDIGVRDAAGTTVWAHGTLVVAGVGPHVVQVSEGRLPVVSGSGGRFDATAP